MLLLVQRIGKLYSNLENFLNHYQPEAVSASLQAFQSDVSGCINQLASNSRPGSEFLSFSWIQQCFQLLPIINKAFAKLVVDIDYPMSKWEANSIEEYFNYSLSLLELLNSISSALSHLGQARLSLSHALSFVENSPSVAIEHFKAIQLKSSSKDFKEQKSKGDIGESSFTDKGRAVHQALKEIKSLGFWICGSVLAGLCGDAKPYLEMRKFADEFAANLLFNGLDSIVCEAIMEKGCVLKEVYDLIVAAASLVSAIIIHNSSESAEEMQRRLEVYEKLLDGL
ncbi:DUF793 domain-containing protein [Cephalotus follicularis]|uniref:DUF793 domain-containing protein n=1 Tax=Cephalotus follicularis TaxID=3775 RepID=A0A1Q3CD23_CEPFO|nr:DUF793 domain-containing protein [Cephalotus follicularis]